MRTSYLRTALQISEDDAGRVVLLNPEIAGPGGDWEVRDFANWYPGARRCQPPADSFREQIEHEGASTADANEMHRWHLRIRGGSTTRWTRRESTWWETSLRRSDGENLMVHRHSRR